jgi:hypothetical protein
LADFKIVAFYHKGVPPVIGRDVIQFIYVFDLSDPDADDVSLLAFAGQIYCDFAGYSICAIGVAMCFGFALPDNFHAPYAALGFSDFWRRWHISLSTWLRDYLYIPLGAARHGLPWEARILAKAATASTP